jgi:TPR repeat protein
VDDKETEDRPYDLDVDKRYRDALAVLESGDTSRAIELFGELAAEGIAPAYTCLGSIYFYGQGVEPSAQKAMQYYLGGAKLGERNSIVLSAELLASGVLGETRHDLALPAYHQAAQLGSPLALRRLGLYYAEGKEVELDLKLAADLLEASAEQGDEYAAYNLAAMYERGNTALDRDLGRAIRWYELAAVKGIPEAKHNLAVCYANPESPVRDLEVAARWFHAAAEHGLTLSMQSLAHIYASGEGVERNLELAEYWRGRAATNENTR